MQSQHFDSLLGCEIHFILGNTHSVGKGKVLESVKMLKRSIISIMCSVHRMPAVFFFSEQAEWYMCGIVYLMFIIPL